MNSDKTKINDYILELLKDKVINKDMALSILKEINGRNKSEIEDIAIIGVSCRLPGANNIEEYWSNLLNEVNSIVPFPEERAQDLVMYDPELPKKVKEVENCAGYLNRISNFDNDFFNISYDEAVAMEPSHRIFLETAYESIVDAGYEKKLGGSNTGVFVGFESSYQSHYNELLKDNQLASIQGSVVGMLANRISYFLDLRGPAMVFNTACSSGMVALHEACTAIRNRECKLAIAGGVNVILLPQLGGKLLDIETQDNKIKSFDCDADGTLWAEGSVSLILKPLEEALRDKDRIYCVVKGSGVNSDGASNGITAPNPEAEMQLLVNTWKRYNIAPQTISYIEAHGTGTLLGDSIELQAINDAFRQTTNEVNICGIGSVKPNIGHSVAVSGLASIVKVLLCLIHKKIPATINYKNPNPYMNYGKSAIYVNDTLREWSSNEGPLRAGVNSFGVSGTNCHVVLEESPQKDIDISKKFAQFQFENKKVWPSPSHKLNDDDYHEIKWVPFEITKNNSEEKCAIVTDQTEWGVQLAHEFQLRNSKSVHFINDNKTEENDLHGHYVTSAIHDIELFIHYVKEQNIHRLVLAMGFESIQMNTESADLYENEILHKSLLFLFHVSKVLDQNNLSDVTIELLGINAQEVTGSENRINALVASVFGLAKVIREEYSGIDCRCFDFDLTTPISEIVDVVESKNKYFMTAIRESKCYYQSLAPVDILSNGGTDRISFKNNGVYLITGALGGFGLEIAHFIAKTQKVKLVFTSRRTIPKKEDWENISIEERTKISDIIQTVEEIEAEGSEVYIYSQDVTNEVEMKKFIPLVESTIGKIDGVLHLAGVPGTGLLWEKDDTTFLSNLAAKTKGTRLLYELTLESKPDFIILFSSIASLVGGMYLGEYVAANSYLDAFSGMKSSTTKFLTINWSTIHNTGMAKGSDNRLDVAFKDIAVSEAVRAFADVIRTNVKHITIGKINYENSLFWNTKLPIELDGQLKRKIKKEASIFQVTLTGREDQAYTPLEIYIAQVWGNLLNREEIDLDDNFFEIGGNSIISIKIVNDLNQKYNILLRITDIFEQSTLGNLAKLVMKLTNNIESKKALEEESIVKRKGEFTLSHSQKRLWFLQKIDPDLVAYNLTFTRRIDKHISVDYLQQAFECLVKRHALLRTVFASKDGNPVQIVKEEYTPHIEFIDLSREVDQERSLTESISHMKLIPFDLKTPPYRIYLYKLSENAYTLYINYHHIIVDGWSITVLYQQLYEYYTDIVNHREIEYKIDTVDYFDWIEDTQVWEKSKEYLVQKEYWKNELVKPLPSLNLPIDKKRPIVQSYSGSYVKIKINENNVKKLKQHTELCHVTMNNCLLSIFFLLLHKLSGDNDIIVGVPTAGRDEKKWEEVTGIFINTLCIRQNFTQVDTFNELQQQVQNKVIHAIEYSRYPFDMIVADINPERDFSRNPIYSVLFQFYDNLQLDNEGVSQFDLSCQAKEVDNCIEVSFEYNTDIFTESTIQQFSQYFMYIIYQILSKPDTEISRIELLDRESKEELLKLCHTPEMEMPEECTVDALFEKQVRLTPNQTAIIFGDEKISYEMLNQRANQVAGILLNKGVQDGELVCILTDRGINTIVGILGILKAGGAYVPIDPSYPTDRIRYIINHSKANFFITEGKFDNLLDSIQDSKLQEDNIICLDRIEKIINELEILRYEPLIPITNRKGSDLMYVIYTSGSTGNPKGVMVSHQNAINYLEWSIHELELNYHDVLMSVTSICFDISVFEMFGALLSGAQLCVVSINNLVEISQLANYIIKNKVTVWHSVPSLMIQLLQYMEQPNKEATKLEVSNSLRHILIGGEAWSVQLAKQIQLAFGSSCIRNMYGPTEATIWVSSYKIDEKQEYKEHPIMLIGKPIANNKILILDQYMNLCPPGVSGELYICGRNVTKGYYSDEEKTKQSFILQENGTVYYKTGDIGRYLKDGNIEYLSRKDNMIKVRGYRIEMGEIENAIKNDTEIENFAVAAVKDDESNKIVCYYTHDHEILVSELKQQLKKRLPGYMIPSQFYFVKNIILTPNGKVDLISMQKFIKPEVRQKSVEIRNSTDQKILEIWKELLGTTDIGIDDNFFDIGGNSVLVIKMQSLIEKEFAQEITIMNLFQFSSIRSISDFLGKKKTDNIEKDIGKKRAELRAQMRKRRSKV